MRPEEKRVAEILVGYISSRDPANNVSYTPGEDPPDLYLHIGSDIFPLEVTSTEVRREAAFGTGTIRERTYVESHKRLLEEIEQYAIAADILKGKYAVRFSRPLATKDFSSLRDAFKSRMMSHLERSRTFAPGIDEVISLDEVELAWVYKLSRDGSKLYEVFEDGAWTETPEFIALVRYMLQKAVDIKSVKLAEVAPLSECILAIINGYVLADDEVLLSACQGLKSVSNFHSIFLLNSNRLIPVHSVYATWL